jgi:hypothetical protein
MNVPNVSYEYLHGNFLTWKFSALNLYQKLIDCEVVRVFLCIVVMLLPLGSYVYRALECS